MISAGGRAAGGGRRAATKGFKWFRVLFYITVISARASCVVYSIFKPSRDYP